MSILDLPNELLVPILDDVITVIKPQESIRSGITKLASTCRRFHEVMQFFLDSTCYIGITIPEMQSQQRHRREYVSERPQVNIGYRLVKYNTKGARGPFVKKLDVYGGFRTSYAEYQMYQGQYQASLGRRRRGHSINPVLNDSIKALNAISTELIHGFRNITTAIFQNSPESLFVHLIPVFQALLEHCPLLSKLKLVLNLSRETSDELETIFKELPDPIISAQLLELDIFIIQHKSAAKFVPVPNEPAGARARSYPINILGKILGSSINSIRALKLNYQIEGTSAPLPQVLDAHKKWNLPVLKSLQFSVTSEIAYTILTDICNINYAHIQELTLNGILIGKLVPGDNKAMNFFQQMSGLKALHIEILNNASLPWLYYLLEIGVKPLFPALRVLEIRLKDSVFIGGFSARSEQSTQFINTINALGKRYKLERIVYSRAIHGVTSMHGQNNFDEIFCFDMLNGP